MADLKFVSYDTQTVYNWVLDKLRDYTGEVAREGDERRIFGEQLVSVIQLNYNDMDIAAKAKMLRYAYGDVLDAMGERLDVVRLAAQPASTWLQFELSAAQPNSVHIPAGTRATPDGKVFFSTVAGLTIKPGDLTGAVEAESLTKGKKYNALEPGEINVLVDPLPFVKSVTNLFATEGGDDVESDDHFRERNRLAPGKLTTAGPTESYVYWALTADAGMNAVSVVSPEPGEIRITALMEDGALPTQAVLDAILETCNDRKRRPLGDHVTVQAPKQAAYGLDLKYYVLPERAGTVKSAVEDTGGVLDQFVAWQCASMGRDLNPDKLTQMLLDAGAIRADIISPVYTPLDAESVAVYDGSRVVAYELSEE